MTMDEDAAMDGTLAGADLERLRKDFSANPVYRLAQNAVTRVTVDDVAINREIVSSIDHSLSTTLDDWKATNQERSGRCWLFAGLNLLRVGGMRETGLKDFEFSQNYAMFWDKLERARAAKAEVLQVIHRVLCIHLGTPPERFDWQWTDKDKKFHRDGVLTPQEFAAKYVDVAVSEYVCLVNDPRPARQTYSLSGRSTYL